MNIGELANITQVDAKTIRRYEEQGVIPKAGRNISGYRQYSEKDVHTIKLVKHAKLLGFSAKDIKQLVSLWRNKSRSSSQVKSIAAKHISVLEQKMIEIQSMLETLKELSIHCHGDSRPDCAILNELGK